MVAPKPDLDPSQAKCGVTKSQAEPLVVEWPSAARGKLESRIRKGLVAVRYEGCEMEVLSQCAASGTYGYGGVTRKKDRIRIKNEDDLYATIPVYAAKFESKLKSAGELNVDMTIVGRYEADRSVVSLPDLQGDCSKATHFVSGITVGSFQFYAGSLGEVGAALEVGKAGLGGKSLASRETLNEDGDDVSCQASAQNDASPPFGCGAILRIEVTKLGKSTGGVVCPTGASWDGKQCAATQVECPAGARWSGTACVAEVSCPLNTVWDGSTCTAAPTGAKATFTCPAGSVWADDKCETCAVIAATFKKTPLQGSAAADRAAQCAYEEIDQKLRAGFDYEFGFHRYEGVIDRVTQTFDADLSKADVWVKELEKIITTYGSKTWSVVARARQGSVYDSCRTGLYNARPPALKLYTDKEEKVLKEAAMSDKEPLQDQADAIRQHRREQWSALRKSKLGSTDKQMIRLYTEAVVWAKEWVISHRYWHHGLQKLAFYTDILGDSNLRAYTQGIVSPDSKQTFQYADGMFLRTRPGKVLSGTAKSVQTAAALLDAGDATKASTILIDHVKSAPEDIPARLDLGDAYRILGKYDEAKKELEWVMGRSPALAETYYNLGLLYLFAPNCTPLWGGAAPPVCLRGFTPLAQVQEATKVLRKFQDLRATGVSDESDELLNRAKLKEGEIVAAQQVTGQ